MSSIKTIKTVISMILLAAVASAGFIYFGFYNMAADEPHWPLTFKLIEMMRDRSIEVRSENIDVPNLDNPNLIAEGAEHYAPMCAGCHLSPDRKDNEFRAGLYPEPPDLTKPTDANAAEQFWVIKHGIKMTAMPAWGKSHDDHVIWGLVAFLQKLPEMSQEEYKLLTGNEPGHDRGNMHSEDGDGNTAHHHEESDIESDPTGHVDPPGTPPHSHDAHQNE